MNTIKYKFLTLILFFAIALNAFAQQTITGIVKSAKDNETLPGVSIVLKGTTNGTVTDFDGNFSFDVPTDGTFVISYIGFQKQEIEIDNQTTFEILLQEDVVKLNEVVVVGYGTQKKSDITGAVASVKVDELQEVPVARADEVLQGRVAGVQVTNNDASPNANIKVRIRGVSSINGGSNPLVIIDGVQGASLSDIHPNDIKSMEVLKDASSTAIYGSRGASGVILITTHKGKGKKPQLTLNSYLSVHNVRKQMDFMDAHQYALNVNENRLARELPIIFSDDELAHYKTNGGTDWQDEIFQTGISQNLHLNINGATENISYSISGDYLDNEGIVIGSSYRKYSMRPNFSVDLSEKFKVSLNSFFSWSNDNPTVINDRDSQGSPVYSALLFAPTKPVFMDDGTYSQPGGGYGPNTEYNPVALATEPMRDNLSNSMYVKPALTWNIVKGLRLDVSGSYQLTDNENSFYYNEKVLNGGESDREASIVDSKWSNYQNTNILTYEKLFGEKHNLKITGVYEQQKSTFNSNYSGARDFLTNSVSYNNLGLGAAPAAPSSYRSEQSLESFMGRVNYSYMDKYSVTLTGRSDGASVFAKNNKRAFFPSAGLAWNISQENFLKDSKTIDNLKLRASYGEVGNAAISPYQSLAQLVTGAYFSFDGDNLTNGINLSTQAPNSDLKWETTKTYNFGVDFMMYRNRLSLTADFYNKDTEDLLMDRALYEASGYQTQLVNAGKINNKGVEIALAGKPVMNNNFVWSSELTFSKNINEVVALNEGESEIRLGGAGLPGFSDAIWLEVGQPIGLIRGLEYAGVWKSDEEILAAVYNVKPGSPKYVDQNNDGIINNDDAVNIANALPDFNLGWNNTFKYKNLSLNIFIVGVQGNDIYNLGRSQMESTDGLSKAMMDSWTPEKENTDIPGHDPLGTFRNSSRWVEDGSYIRVKNITLGYDFSKNVASALGIGSARIYISGTNLLTLTDYSGFDPESNNSNGSDTFAGVDLASYPSQKKFTIGLDIKF